MSAAIEVSGLTFAYGAAPVLRGVSFHIQEGERVGLAGANGSGKSTLLWCLAGLLRAPGVRVACPGGLGFVFQNPEDQLFMPSLLQDLALPLIQAGEARDRAREAAIECLRRFGLEAFADEPAAHLSLGQRKRAALALALVRRPGLLLLDEPTAELDGRAVRLLAAMLRELAVTQFIASHHLEFLARVTDRLLVLGGGTLLFDGPTTEGLADGELLDRAGLV